LHYLILFSVIVAGVAAQTDTNLVESKISLAVKTSRVKIFILSPLFLCSIRSCIVIFGYYVALAACQESQLK